MGGRRFTEYGARVLGISIAAVWLAGCPSTNVFRTAEPVPQGQWEITGGIAAGFMQDTEQNTRFPTGQGELGVRRGITDNIDVGAKAFFPGGEINSTIRFVKSGNWSASVAPQIGAARTPETGATTDAFFLFPQVTQLTTYRLSETWAFTGAPYLGMGVYWPNTGGDSKGLWVGLAANAEWRLDKRFRLVPELTAYKVVSGDVPVHGGAVLAGAGFRISL